MRRHSRREPTPLASPETQAAPARRGRAALRGKSFTEQLAALRPGPDRVPGNIAGAVRGDALADRMTGGPTDRFSEQAGQRGLPTLGEGAPRGAGTLAEGRDWRGAAPLGGGLAAGGPLGALIGDRGPLGGLGAAGADPLAKNPAFAGGHAKGGIFGGTLRDAPTAPGRGPDSRLAAGSTGTDDLQHEVNKQMLGGDTSAKTLAAIGTKLMAEAPTTGDPVKDAVNRGVIAQQTGATVSDSDQKLIDQAVQGTGSGGGSSSQGSGGTGGGKTDDSGGGKTEDSGGNAGGTDGGSGSDGAAPASGQDGPGTARSAPAGMPDPSRDTGGGLRGGSLGTMLGQLAARGGGGGGMKRGDLKAGMAKAPKRADKARRLDAKSGLAPYILTDSAGQSGGPAVPDGAGGALPTTDPMDGLVNPGAGHDLDGSQGGAGGPWP